MKFSGVLKPLLSFFLFPLPLLVIGQVNEENTTEEKIKLAPPAFQTNRANEEYSYLKKAESNPHEAGFADALKLIPLSQNEKIYFTLGGQYRPRFEYSSNLNYSQEGENYYSQRLNFHTNLVLGKFIRVYGEVYHGYTSDQQRLLETDDIDFHQVFVDAKIISSEKNNLSFRLGRQELALGASRLIGIREGPNMRRSFDMAKLTYKKSNTNVIAFYGKEVTPRFGAFDNEFNLFNKESTNPEIWGAGAQFPIKKLTGTNEVYYLGFRSKNAGFSDVFGEEVRHSVGLRRFGKISKSVSYNTEVVYQFGDLAGNTISALNIETDWKYKFSESKFGTTLGFKFDWSTGDKETGDNKVNTFNPLFVNPAIYSLAAVNTPANLTSFHPNITIQPMRDLSVYMDYAVFYRTTKQDGLYTPPRFQIREANGLSEKHVGDAFGIQVNYEINRNISLDLRSTYFIPGKFIKASGEAESIFYIAPTMSFRF